MKDLSPTEIFQQLSEALPEECLENLVVVGSLAAGFHYFKDEPERAVRTKDVDCILEPFHMAIHAGQKIASQLLDLGWKHRSIKGERPPGTLATKEEDLPAIRLVPPMMNPHTPDWFIELLCVPKDPITNGRTYTPIKLGNQHFVLPSFQFMALTGWRPYISDMHRLRYARPSMMALANLLAHPEIGQDTMSATISGRKIKRANKDLGRVLALAKLENLHDYEPWGIEWLEAIKEAYGKAWITYASRLGRGLHALLSSPNDLDEAVHTCSVGLLSSLPTSTESLKIVGQRLLGDAVAFVEDEANKK